MDYENMNIEELKRALDENVEYWDSLESSRDALDNELGQNEDYDEDIQAEIDDIQDEMDNIENVIFEIQNILNEKAE